MMPLIARLSIVLSLLLLGALPARSQISPGPLSKSHDFLSGSTRCKDCHDVGKRPPEYKCLECHKEIRQRLDERRGLHPSLLGAEKTGRACIACHSDHNGKDFTLVHWNEPVAKFDHRRAGYALEGQHSKILCKSCHQSSRVSAVEASTLLVKDLDRTFLGLSRKCLTCHADEHRGQFAGNCDQCHGFANWKIGTTFNHSRARFTLQGKHEKVECQKCHNQVQETKPYTKFKGLSFNDCTPCHSDPHRGAFRASCKSCHSPWDWRAPQVTSLFKHAATSFPLLGKHEGVSCASCHRKNAFKEPIPHTMCKDCHKTDPHREQFSRRKEGADCSACHTEAGFIPSTFGMKQHQLSSYPLEGKHSAVVCAKCHIPRGPDTVYRVSSTQCSSCHTDIHQGQFKTSPHLKNCESCHTLKGFQPSTFTLVRHKATPFPLSGGHAAVTCKECHVSPGNAYPPAPAKFRFEDRACTACHSDPHKGQFAQRMAMIRPDGSTRGCETCHTTKTWKDLPGFDHSTTEFLLGGSHRAVVCESCHKPAALETGLGKVNFRAAPRNCAGCHEDVHAEQFSTTSTPVDCARCHRVIRWKPSTFDHATGSTYPLTGAHQDVRCALCHTARREVAGRMVVFYKNTPRACDACHGSEMKAKTGRSGNNSPWR